MWQRPAGVGKCRGDAVLTMATPAVARPDCAAIRFPRTRYLGSKRRIADFIVEEVSRLDFDCVLDAFGGTGAVAHAFKRAGKAVTYNDGLEFNHQIGLALIENDGVALSAEEIESIGRRHDGVVYPDFIERTFDGIYFTRAENRWLDAAVTNIRGLSCRYKRALAWFAVFQSAMAKRPYNLFHRKNLYMRTADVERSFGNKRSWDRSFAEHFASFSDEAASGLIDSGGRCRAVCADALDLEPGYDMVYIDTPYISRAGVGVCYRDFYHFLEGLVAYDTWETMIDYKSKHRRLSAGGVDPWTCAARCREQFHGLFALFRESNLVVSYRDDGIPGIDELVAMLSCFKRVVEVVDGRRRQYALSTRRKTREVLIIATDG